MNKELAEKILTEYKPTAPFIVEDDKVIFLCVDGRIVVEFQNRYAKATSSLAPDKIAVNFITAGYAFYSAGTFIDKYNTALHFIIS